MANSIRVAKLRTLLHPLEYSGVWLVPPLLHSAKSNVKVAAAALENSSFIWAPTYSVDYLDSASLDRRMSVHITT